MKYLPFTMLPIEVPNCYPASPIIHLVEYHNSDKSGLPRCKWYTARYQEGGATLQLSWTTKTNPWALTLFFK